MELNFGEILRLKRTRAGITLQKVGAKTGFHFATIAKWERTIRSWKELPYETVELLAFAVGCSVEEIKNEEAA